MSWKSFLETKVFSSIGVGGIPWGPWGLLKPPLWSLANIKCDAVNITFGAAIILHGPTIILLGMTRICSKVHDILHFQHHGFHFLGGGGGQSPKW